MSKITGYEPIYGALNYKKYGPYKSEEISQSPGLTIRQHFAAMAMQALVGNNFSPQGFQNGDQTALATVAVKCADALIAELNK